MGNKMKETRRTDVKNRALFPSRILFFLLLLLLFLLNRPLFLSPYTCPRNKDRERSVLPASSCIHRCVGVKIYICERERERERGRNTARSHSNPESPKQKSHKDVNSLFDAYVTPSLRDESQQIETLIGQLTEDPLVVNFPPCSSPRWRSRFLSFFLSFLALSCRAF
jgi:hypothetical protein